LVPVAPVVEERSAKPRAKRVKVKVDPSLVAKARELRDRWMECVNADPSRMIGGGKYDPGKQLAPSQTPGASPKLLEAA
jgi:hypothetical protein